MLLAIAPMMGYTYREARYLFRLLAPTVKLYTEMIPVAALLQGSAHQHLAFHASEHPIALQLGGSDPLSLAKGARLGEEAGYDEINLNVGCPSHRVRNAKFGVCLMFEPHVVAECVASMMAQVSIPVTVKCRLGVDQQDDFAFLSRFVEIVAQAGCQHFIVHARTAWLQGLDPQANRTVPPLQYDRVHLLKQHFPQLTIVLNGGLQTISALQHHLRYVDGVMIGRRAYTHPYFLYQLHYCLLKQAGDDDVLLAQFQAARLEMIETFLAYAQGQWARGRTSHTRLLAPLMHLFRDEPGANQWRRYLSEHRQAHTPMAIVHAALAAWRSEQERLTGSSSLKYDDAISV